MSGFELKECLIFKECILTTFLNTEVILFKCLNHRQQCLQTIFFNPLVFCKSNHRTCPSLWQSFCPYSLCHSMTPGKFLMGTSCASTMHPRPCTQWLLPLCIIEEANFWHEWNRESWGLLVHTNTSSWHLSI